MNVRVTMFCRWITREASCFFNVSTDSKNNKSYANVKENNTSFLTKPFQVSFLVTGENFSL